MKTTYYGQLILRHIDRHLWSSNTLKFHMQGRSSGPFWLNQFFTGSSSSNDEEMDAYELGWRTRPSDKLLIELSLYHYSTKNAVFSGPPKYDTSDVKTTGGELTFDYRASRSWHLQGGYSYSKR